MDFSATAKNNAISFEVKKDGLTQRQGGDWSLRLTVAAVDMDQRITTAPMGARFACVLVEINDDESPKDHKAEDRDKWRALGATKQAGIRCKEPLFWHYLFEELHYPEIDNEAFAASIVREICGVESRSELDNLSKAEARRTWHELDRAYQAFKVREHG